MIRQMLVCCTIFFSKTIIKMTAIDLRKQQAKQEISFTGNLEEQSTIFCTVEEAKETVLGF